MANIRCQPSLFTLVSFTEVLAELPALTIEERQLLVRRAVELDDPGLSVEDESLVEKRLADHRRNPNSAEALKKIKKTSAFPILLSIKS
jgi:hypothetical protein